MNLNFTSSFKSFNDKQKSLFDQLEVAEKNNKDLLSNNTVAPDETVTDDVDDTTAMHLIRKRNTRKFSGQESIFKKPQTRAPKNFTNRRVPDYWKNPSKWTRYSLADVSSEDMSERANTATAMAFLKELQDRKRATDEEDEPLQELPEKVTFRKIVKPSTDANTSTPVFQNSKWLMPEYVIGQKNTKSNKQKKLSGDRISKKAQEIKLDHLLDED